MFLVKLLAQELRLDKLIFCVIWAVVLFLGLLVVGLTAPFWLKVIAWPCAFLYALLLYLAFFVKFKKWGKFFVFEEVPVNSRLILRWQLAGKINPRDPHFFVMLSPGYVIYIAWFYAREGIVDLSPIVLPQKPQEVKALDGPAMFVDTQLTADIVDPIAFLINAKNNRAGLQKILEEYLKAALQWATSVKKDQELKIIEEGGQIREIKGWDSTAGDLSALSNERLDDMGRYVNYLVNDRLERGKSKDDLWGFGVHVTIQVSDIKAEETVRKALEAAAAVEFQVKETRRESEVAAEAARRFAEIKGINATWPAAIIAATPLVRDLVEQLRKDGNGGRKKEQGSSATSEDESEGEKKPQKKGK